MKTTNQYSNPQHFVVKPHQLQTQIFDDSYSPKLKAKRDKRLPFYTIPNLISTAEAKALIELGGIYGFQQAGLAFGQDQYRVKESTRNNKRFLFEDKTLAAQLMLRCGDLLDTSYQNYQLKALNWRFRLYKYDQGGYFAAHVDERMELPNGMMSLFTFMIYLNVPKKGGATSFFEPTHRRKNRKVYRAIRPKTGMALVFDHLLFHEGALVEQGTKYVLRTDVLYQK